MKSQRPQSKVTSVKTPSSPPLSGDTSAMLSAMQAMSTRIEELESEREKNQADRVELARLRTELAELKAKPSETPNHETTKRKPLSAGWF